MSALCLGCDRPIAEVSGMQLDIAVRIAGSVTAAHIPLCARCGDEALHIIARYLGLTPGELARLAREEMIGGQTMTVGAEA